ncbi:hypothetical protein M440DRAFT_1399288 [Trichoderma longibrachiatum ATCC 18648]|uniref:Uncharacterized protein n=1 Tax=Trichoderma longibrachiatum ATCC 18648 TaxID=983965 RepID=A0A2T4C978_TRILO|nr:hypothetical protein M440DRAFT_1399288 [Trichoderma longibrachiatum ATCC 18648]
MYWYALYHEVETTYLQTMHRRLDTPTRLTLMPISLIVAAAHESLLDLIKVFSASHSISAIKLSETGK